MNDKFYVEEVPSDDKDMMSHMLWTGFEWVEIPDNWLPVGDIEPFGNSQIHVRRWGKSQTAKHTFGYKAQAKRGGIPF